MKPDISLAGMINSLVSLLNLRNFIIILGVLASIVFYFFLADYYLPFKQAANYLKAKKEVYTFYSGSEGGFYHKIGNAVEQQMQSDDGEVESNINIKVAESTSGGLDNAVQVLSGDNSFGLIQGSTLNRSDELRDKINYISPLYMERLHIICKSDWLKGNIKELSPKRNNSSGDIFDDAVISIGEVGSGTRVIASYLLETLESNPKEIRSLSQQKGLDALQSDSIDVFMVIVGAPLQQYLDLLEKDSAYTLIGVSPTLIVEINEKFSTNYRVSNFKSKYRGFEDINTIGSYSYLISSIDVEESMNIEMLRLVAGISKGLKASLDIENWENRSFQLDEIKFHSGVDSKESDIEAELSKSMLLFFITVIVSSFFAIWTLIWIFSSMKMARYFRLITYVYRKYFPETVDLNRNTSAVYIGEVPPNGSNQINMLILGIDELRKLKTEERADYDSGGISESHFRSLMNSTQWALEEFRTALTRTITYDIRHNEKSDYINEEVLTNYYASAFLTKEQYHMLSNVLLERN